MAKLQDGNLWMTQNLALGDSTAMNLTQANSNVGPSGFTLPASVTEGSWTGSDDNPEFFNYAGNYASQQATNKYGNYYNWPAATAGSGTSATTSGDAQYSICPKNWHLPSAGNSYTASEQYIMLNNYITTGTWNSGTFPSWSDVTITEYADAPISLVFAGYYSGNLNDQGSSSNWWQSTAYDNDDAYYFGARSNGRVTPRFSSFKRLGFSVRCLMPGA